MSRPSNTHRAHAPVASIFVFALAACETTDVDVLVDEPATVDAGVDTGPDTTGVVDKEPCNGLDDNGNRRIDEGCACTPGMTQPCYPGAQMPASCKKGTQTCASIGNATSWGECKDALVPLAGQTECCTALTAMPEHAALSKFVAAYPLTALPSSPAAVNTFKPVAGGFKLVNGTVVVGNEFIDPGRGGVTATNLLAGRAAARAEAFTNLKVNAADVIHTEEPAPIIMGSGCGGWGGALGSVLYRTQERGVREIVYFYVGVCNGGDAEGFYHSELALDVCTAGSLPR
jgi:hypothetical protein